MNGWAIVDLVPHTGPMVLLDELLDFGTDHVACAMTVREGTMFVDAASGFPAWAGIELMAQAIAVWNGCTARTQGDAVRPGFLLGTRSYSCPVTHFPIGAKLRVLAERGFNDPEGMAAFNCSIEHGDTRAQARLTVFSPPDAAALLSPDHPLLEPGNPS
jgi:predicted hotdog family 3-hydroxylacyl-ACP dehydratase